jgi:hypothetical protein
MNARIYAVLLLVTILCGVGGVLTMIPASGASYPNVLGYRSLCTFAPAATLYCFAIAGTVCILRASFVKRAAYNDGKPVFKPGAIVVVLVVLILAIASHAWVVGVKADYTDGGTAPTEQT